MEVKPGETRYHSQIGMCDIFWMEGRVGFPVVVAKNKYGRAIGVYDLAVLDERGWSPPRKKKGWTDDEKKEVVRLRAEGFSHREIAEMTGSTRSSISRLITGMPPGKREKSRSNVWLTDSEKQEIRELRKKGWRSSVLAYWIGCSEQAVLDVATGR